MSCHRGKPFITNLVPLLFCVLLVMVGCTTTTSGLDAAEIEGQSPETEQLYSIGELGPAKGIVFYDKGEYSNDWRYLEMAPVETQVPLQWGAFEHFVSNTSSEIGMGLQNTENIVASLEVLEEKGRAAQYCSELVVNGYSDWFLPSKNELDQIYWQLAFKDPSKFLGTGYGYWSSTEFDEEKAWGQGFSAGVQGRIEKFDIFLVRAIRAF
jgi:hypothetical protein